MLIRKFLIFIAISAIIIGLSACSKPFMSHLWVDDDTIADSRLQDIITALERKDRDALKKMFSKKALEEADDIDAGINYAIEFYQGNTISQEGSPMALAQKRDGKKKEELKGYYTVVTDKQEYLVFFIEQTVNDEHPEEVGLYMLQVIKKEDEDELFDWGNTSRCAGVYQPKK